MARFGVHAAHFEEIYVSLDEFRKLLCICDEAMLDEA